MVARFNHSCMPNVHNNWNFESQTETLNVVQDICKGEELCTTYLKPPNLYRPIKERRQLLWRSKFQCNCEVCNLMEEAKESDQCRKDLQNLTYQLDGSVREQDHF